MATAAVSFRRDEALLGARGWGITKQILNTLSWTPLDYGSRF